MPCQLDCFPFYCSAKKKNIKTFSDHRFDRLDSSTSLSPQYQLENFIRACSSQNQLNLLKSFNFAPYVKLLSLGRQKHNYLQSKRNESDMEIHRIALFDRTASRGGWFLSSSMSRFWKSTYCSGLMCMLFPGIWKDLDARARSEGKCFDWTIPILDASTAISLCTPHVRQSRKFGPLSSVDAFRTELTRWFDRNERKVFFVFFFFCSSEKTTLSAHFLCIVGVLALIRRNECVEEVELEITF